MNKSHRLVLFAIELVALIIISQICTGNCINAFSDLWFSSGLLMLILLSLIDQPFFSKDANIFVNAVTSFLALLIVEQNSRDWIFWTFFGIVIYLLLSSYILMWLRKNPLNEENKFIQFLSRFNRFIGKPQVLFSAFFIWGAILKFGISTRDSAPIFWYWLIVILLDTSSFAKFIAELFMKKKEEITTSAIGTILGVQGRNILLVKMFPLNQRKTVSIFEPVEFLLKSNKKTGKGIIIESYLLNEEQWTKILINSTDLNTDLELFGNKGKMSEDIVYKLDIPNDKNIPFLDTFIGVIYENSDIEKVYFVYDSKIDIESGMLVEVHQRDKKIIYQIFNGITRQELLEAKNKSDMILGTALQLGVWDEKSNRFEKYGWVPSINTPVHLASSPKLSKVNEGIIELGKVPNTNFPVLMDIDTAITHHMAVLGVTGTGKSFFVREKLIKEYISKSNRKIFIIDFTGEHKKEIKKITPFMSVDVENEIYKSFDIINTEMEKFANQRDKKALSDAKEYIDSKMIEAIDAFLKSDEKIKIIELPDVQNTQNIFDFTKVLFKQIFTIAKSNLGKTDSPQLCIVLEEAHTIIPEWNFASESNKNSQASMNAISQIALQGRKYNVGLLVIAQRTANVSKTVLTQCNSIISFTEYDKTSIDFLANYFGEEIASILPTLKFRQAVAAGKAFASTVPMIFEVPEITKFEHKNSAVLKTSN